MPEKKAPTKTRKPSAATAKQEMLGAYQEVIGDLDAQRDTEMKPEEKIAEKAKKAAVATADDMTTERIAKDLAALKSEIVRTLAGMGDRLEAEASRYQEIRRAVEVKERELQEIYEIQKSASTLAALLEVQQQKKDEFEREAAAKKEELAVEIERTRSEWAEEEGRHDEERKEKQDVEKKTREREREDYDYRFKREQQLAREKFEDEKARAERDLQVKKADQEAKLAEREKAVAAREGELAELRTQADGARKVLDEAVARAVKEAVARVQQEAGNHEQLMQKQFDGEKNVLLARIDALEKTAKDQAAQIAKLTQSLEKAYGQVQDIAVKSVEGVSRVKAQAQSEQLASEQNRKGQEK